QRDRADQAVPHFRRIIEVDPDRREAAERLAAHYRDSGRAHELLELYRELAERRETARGRAEAHLELGELYESGDQVEEIADEEDFDALETPARLYHEALKIDPGNLDALRKLVTVLEALAERDGLEAEASFDSRTVGRLLEETLRKQAELEPEPADQGYAYERLASLAQHRGDDEGAEKARRRAEDAFRRANETTDEEVDARLDQILNEISGKAEEDGEKPSGGLSIPSPDDVRDRRPAEPSPDEVDLTGSQSGLDDDSDTEEIEEPTEEELATGGDEPPPEEVERERLTGFRKRYRELFDDRSAGRGSRPRRPDQDAEKTPPAKTPPAETPSEETRSSEKTQTKTPDVDEMRAAIADARESDDQAALAEAIEALITAHEQSRVELDEAEYLDLSLEVGELYYYDLDDGGRARRHLERVREADPEGRGSRPVVLNTLEAIYEESGAVDERMALLAAKLEGADSEEMAVTYRLLLAQLVWDERSDAAGARRYLDEVLDTDPRHEAAHRLLARIARSEGELETAADHLRTVLEVAGGGLDAVEIERELADLLFDELERPDEAIAHFENVLEAAPADSGALERIKECRAALGDWAGYLECLGHELGLLIGRPDGLDVEQMQRLDPDEVAAAVRVPASQILADAAHVAGRELEDKQAAHRLWGAAFSLWPEHVEALERRIELDRALDKKPELAEDLEEYADLLLDAHARFQALYEAAYLHAKELGRADPARQLLAEAIALVQDDPDPPERLDRARRAFRALQSNQER
ncbi:MAG: hypothetical protein ACOCV2_15310, partial [Persicimonas sp.]